MMRFFKCQLLVVLLVTTFTLIGQEQVPNKLHTYMPAPGQFINTLFGFPSAATSIVNSSSGGLTLGAFGGHIIVGFDKPIQNDADNPYGVDFTIFGNANQSSNEPGIVYVMKDENKNLLPDDVWYVLAGADYWFSSTIKDYEITYTNSGDTVASDIYWTDSEGQEGIIPSNNFHMQPYYPSSDSFPNISPDKYSLMGVKIKDRIDRSNEQFVTSSKHPFGFADNLSRNNSYTGWEPDNPYTDDIEGTGGDAFDISWAIDESANYIDLDEISFIKIQTGVNALMGWLGEVSTEVTGVIDVAPNSSLEGNDLVVAIEPINSELTIGTSVTLNAFVFQQGRYSPNESLVWESSNNDIASVTENGLVIINNSGECYVKASLQENSQITDSIAITIGPETNIYAEESQIEIFPNPCTNWVGFSSKIRFEKYTIRDLNGKVRQHGAVASDVFEIANLIPGFYYIEFSSGERKFIKKLVKQQ